MVIVADRPPDVKSEQHPLALLVRRLLRGAMDVVACLGSAFDRRELALQADRIHDASLGRLIYVAALGAERAAIQQCGCLDRFDRVIRLGLDAQRFDAIEDGHYGAAFDVVGRGRGQLRLVATTAERNLTGMQV